MDRDRYAWHPLRSEHPGRHIRFTIEEAGPVIYVLFFTLVGARFQIALLLAMGLIGIAYVVLRSSGKFIGAWVGGTLGGAESAERNNLGLGLLSQAGVAIGLVLESASRFSASGEEGKALGDLSIGVITATTFVVQIAGPICASSPSAGRVRSDEPASSITAGHLRGRSSRYGIVILILAMTCEEFGQRQRGALGAFGGS